MHSFHQCWGALAPYLVLLAAVKLSSVKHSQKWASIFQFLFYIFFIKEWLCENLLLCSFSTRIQILWFMLDVEKEETKWQRFAV